MKRCPECRRDYFDDSLLYCLDDGAALLEGPSSISGREEPRTEIFPKTDAPGEATTRPLLHTTDIPLSSGRWISVRKPFLVALAALILLVSGYFGYRYFARKPINSIAVMPFVNASGNPDLEYLSDGMTETLITDLSRLPHMNVKARSAVFRYKGQTTDTRTVGTELNAQAMLNGRVIQRADELIVRLELIDSQTENVIWAGEYNRKPTDLIAVQKEIIQDVVGKLTSKLSLTDEQKLSKTATTNPDAYRLVLQGRYFLDRSTQEDMVRAMAYLQQSINADQNCAVCWADLGRAYAIQAGRAWAPEAEAFEHSRDATKHALALDPELAEGYAQLGRIEVTYDLDLPAAEASYRRALELAPSNASVQDGAAVLFYKLGKFEEAIDLSHRALDEDPLSPSFYHNLGLTCFAAGRLAESEQAFRKSIELAPQRIVSNALLSLVLLDQGRTDDSLAQVQREPDEVWNLWATAIVDQRSGKKAGSDAAVKKLVSEHAVGNAFQIAEVYAVRGDGDEAFKWLETAYQKRDSGVTHAKVDPELASLHNDPRWGPFLKKLGFA
jgi:TolB-like protein/Flp pilus assembly protein TadD